MNYLGHVISKDGVETDPEKIYSAVNWKRSYYVKEFRSYLGYYIRYVRGFAKIAGLLHKFANEIKYVVKEELHVILGYEL